MKKGRLRVLLGAAPGVGKTYAMLEEGPGCRPRAETSWWRSSRPTAAPRRPPCSRPRGAAPASTSTHRGVELDEMDLAGGDRPPPRRRPRRRARPHQRPRQRAREALAGRRVAARGRHRRHLDRQRAAHRVARATSSSRSPGRRSARPIPDAGAARRRPDRGHRPRAAGPPRPARRGQRLPGGPRSTPLCRTTSGWATSRPSASSPCSGSPTRSTPPSRRTAPSTASTASGRPASASSSP